MSFKLEFLIMRGAILLSCFCVTVIAQSASVEGIAVNTATAEPLSGVHVRLLAGNARTAPTAVYGAMSVRMGHFSISELPAESYLLMVEKSGFAQISASRPMLSLKAGQHLSGFRIE